MKKNTSKVIIDKNGDNTLKNLCKWFNSLKDDEQINILEYLLAKTDELKVSEKGNEKLWELVESIIKFIVLKNDNKEEILQILTSYGLDKIFASGFYAYCRDMAEPYFDAKIINSMSKEHLSSLCSFILDHMILYNDYADIPFSKFASLIGFEENMELAKSALSFIRTQYFNVCNRRYSPMALEKMLLNEYEIKMELVKEIINPIKENLQEIHQAHLLNQVNKILEKISCPESFINREKDTESA